MPTFADRLKELRTAAGLSQSELAVKSGMSLSAVHDYEQGKREPSLRSAVKLAEAIGTDCRAFAESVKAEEAAPPPKGKAAGQAKGSRPATGPPKKRAARRDKGT